MNDAPLNFSERLQKLREEKAKQSGQPQEHQFDKEDIPDVGQGNYPTDTDVDGVVASIDIITAYRKWINKSEVKPGSKTESIKISCPKPDHPDRDPSAWLNTEKRTWFCGGCQEGGDVYDLAAIHFGYPIPGYKDGQTFHKLRLQMAEDFGYTVKKVAGGELVYKTEPPTPEQPQPKLKEAPQQPTDDQESEGEATVTELHPELEDELIIYPSIDWRSIVPEETFLYEYLTACSNDDAPEEYHFWHGLLALGHAAGRNVCLDDHKPVYGNLLLCLLGASGVGKSRSRGWLDTVLRAVLPYQETGQSTTGTKIIAVPGSGEYLVKEFSYEASDPTNPKNKWYESVNGIVDFDEMSALINRANRQGSTLKTTIMSLADARDFVSVGSLTHKTLHAERPYCSITATTQPRAVRAVLNKQDAASGFINRWVFAGGPEKEREVIGGKRSSMAVNLDTAVEQLKQVRGWAARTRVIEWEDDAAELITRFFKRAVYPAQRKDDSDILKRLDLLLKKLCLLFTINLKHDTVHVETVRSVMAISEYIIDCYEIGRAHV